MQGVKSVWDFIQNEVLGMKWLNRLIGSLLESLGLDVGGKVGGTVQFFLYDVVKIMVLLGVLILIISYIQSYFPPERTKKILGRFHGIGANCIAALLGTVTPFCSCSSIPLFIGFTSAGLPLGVTFSFLISSPMVDLGSLVLLMSIFGWKVAIVYVVLGLVIAVAGGTLIEKLHLEKYVEEYIRNGRYIDIPRCIYVLAIQSISLRVDGTPKNPVLRSYYEEKCKTKSKMTALGAIMHKVCNIIYAVLRDEKPFVLITPEEHKAAYLAA